MKIALIGYGKMGKMIEQIARDRGHEIVSIIDIDNQQDFDSPAFRSADVAIEFTAPQAAYGNYLKAWEQGVKVVSGSTGWMKEHGDDVRQQCANGKTLFWASNFSIGVAIFSAVNRYLAKIMNQFPQYDVEMEETHHVHKLDHPSGTAITLAEEIVENIDRIKGWEGHLEASPSPSEGGDVELHHSTVSGNQTPSPSEGLGEAFLPIVCYRRGEVPGIHTIRYDSDADLITITHDAHSRKGFALGAVLAAEFTKEHQGLLTISDMFSF
jgi:4-hydroxy-tetrahydrodipicolinate reductase